MTSLLFNVITLVVTAVSGAASRPSPLASSAITKTKPEPQTDDWRTEIAGAWHEVSVAKLPSAFASRSVARPPRVVEQPAGAMPKVPQGFVVEQVATGLDEPRRLTFAPSGELFVALSRSGKILRVVRDPLGTATSTVFAANLDQPFGLEFYPPGDHPHWLYVGNNNSIVRFAYQTGDREAQGGPQVIVAKLSPTSFGHVTRDLQFTRAGDRFFVSVGSESNVAETIGYQTIPEQKRFAAEHGVGAAWGSETDRAMVVSFRADGSDRQTFATGLRNCVGLTLRPETDELWCVVNERDGLGDDLVPDYMAKVAQGDFFGWPWFYLGRHRDPRVAARGERADLEDKIRVPELLFQAHSAALQVRFYTGAMFPADYRGHAFVALHGSWNRSRRTGYKVVRVPFTEGVIAPRYQDFMTGFVIDDDRVWGRPVGLAVARDGALWVSDDGGGSIFRVSYVGPSPQSPQAQPSPSPSRE